MLPRPLVLLAGLAAGATIAFLLDPASGRSRRASARVRGSALARRALQSAERRAADWAHRAQGRLARAGGRFEPAEADDRILAERVRATLGHLVRRAHARLIQVSARDGCVILSGPVLQGELSAVLARVRAIPGVRRIESSLEVIDGVRAARGA